MLSQALAQQIAGEISEIIGFNVLITDGQATVVGSGDVTRVGTFHEASIDVLRSGRPMSHDIEEAQALAGSLPGLTIPLVRSGMVVGTVGLSGAPDDVQQFGMIVKRQIEILLREGDRIDRKLSHRRAADELIGDLFDLHRSSLPLEPLQRRLRVLGRDPDAPSVVVAVEAQPLPTHGDDEPPAVGEFVDICLTLLPAGTIGANLSRNTAAFVVTHRSDSSRPARETCELLTSDPALGRWSVRAAAGSLAESAADLEHSARDSYDALRLGRAVDPAVRAHSIEDFRIEQLLRAVPSETRDRLVRVILGDAPASGDWPTIARTIRVWGETGFNASRTAERLHTHRNTVAYRLTKVRSQSHPARHCSPTALYLTVLLASV